MIDWDSMVVGPTTATFGDPDVLFQPRCGTPYKVTGVFDEAYQEMAGIDGLFPSNITNTRPVLGVQLSQFVTPPVQDDAVTIPSNGRTYWINEVQPDSHGGALLLLGNAPTLGAGAA